MRWLWRVVIAFPLLFGGSLLFEGRASAQSPAETASAALDSGNLIEQGAELYEELRYEEALQVLSAALVRVGNTEEDQAAIYRLLAYTYAALERREEAKGAFRGLLALRPDFQLDELSPRLRGFFGTVRGEWEAEGRPGLPPPTPVTIRHTSPPQAEIGQSVELSATIEDPESRTAQLVLAYRQGTASVFRRVQTRFVQNAYRATIPGSDVSPPLVEYYFEALAASGLPVASKGDVAAPLRVAVPEEVEEPIYTKWWFWTAAGAVVVAAVVVGVLLASGGEDGQPTGKLVINVD